MRIELTDEIVKIITMGCPLPPEDCGESCFTQCALASACLEYWTGDDRMNKEENKNV